MVWGTLDRCIQKRDGGLPSHTTSKNTKWIRDFNLRPETIEPVEVNSDIALSSISADVSPQASAAEAKINKWDDMELERAP